MENVQGFALRGSVVDLAVGIIIGAAFGAIVNSFVSDIVMPPVGLVLGRVDFSNLFVNLSGQTYPSLKAAREARAAVIAYGAFLNAVVNFLIVAFAVFQVVRITNRFRREAPVAAPSAKECPQCGMSIPLVARRCLHCTSQLSS
ncbi:MAG: large conductance mechanosensitive channel protein MscL [Armatimonadota bacterium]|nr:large conductance mechanosensitive channel protein MscL [Armatimonadota bacterium]